MFIAANVRSKLSKLLQDIKFVESMRRTHEVTEWYHGKSMVKKLSYVFGTFVKNTKSHCFR